MKKLSLPEFRDYCEEYIFDKIIYSSVNQPSHSIDTTSSMSLVFDKMLMTLNPNIIHLKGGGSSLRLNKVKYIKIHEDELLIGNIFTVLCGNSLDNKADTEYILIGQR